jgi:hypothetical protein
MANEAPQNTNAENSDRIELFVTLLGAHQQPMRYYVLSVDRLRLSDRLAAVAAVAAA